MRRSLPALILVVLAVPAAAHAAPRVAEFDMDVPIHAMASAAAIGAPVTTAVLRPGRRFDLVGARWRSGGELEEGWVRTRSEGRWSRWVPLAAGHGSRASDPVWAGGADALQLRWRSAPAGMRLRFVRVTDRVRLPARAKAAQAAGPPAMVGRAQWDPGNACRPREAPEYGQVQMAFVHHTVTTNEYAPEDSPAIVLGVCRYHRNSNGWNDIGYNFLVDRYGRLFEGRAGGVDQPVVGAQASGWNSVSTSVSNIGTFTEEPASDAALTSMNQLLTWKLGLHGAPSTGTTTLTSSDGHVRTFERISGHRDGGSTACPGQALYDQLPALRAMAAGAAPPAPPPEGTVTLQALSTAVTWPEPVRLSGTVSGGSEVRVQVAAGARYRTIATTTPSPDGTWTAEVPLTANHTVRAVQILPDGRPGAASPTLRIAVRPVVTATGPPRVLAGRALAVSGTIAPAKSVVTASTWIQRRDGTYAYVRRFNVRARDGRFRGRVPLVRPGLYRISVRFPGTRCASASETVELYARAVRNARDVSGGAAGPEG